VTPSSNAWYSALTADHWCGEGTELILYLEPGAVLSRPFDAADTHDPDTGELSEYGLNLVSLVVCCAAKYWLSVTCICAMLIISSNLMRGLTIADGHKHQHRQSSCTPIRTKRRDRGSPQPSPSHRPSWESRRRPTSQPGRTSFCPSPPTKTYGKPWQWTTSTPRAKCTPTRPTSITTPKFWCLRCVHGRVSVV